MSNFNLDKVKAKTLAKYPLFGRIIANVELVETNKTKTAGTEGKKIYFNPEFMSSLSQDEQIFVFAHEICHIALNHIKRGEGKDKKIWNKAADAVTNANLENDGLVMPKGGIKIFDAMNKDAEELYEKLLKEKEERQNSRMPEEEDEPNFDDHDIWDDENSISEDLDDDIDDKSLNEGKKENILKKIFRNLKKDKKDDSNNSNQKSDIQDAIDKITNLKEKKLFEKNKEQRQKKLEEMLKNLENEQISAGANAGLQEINIGDVGNETNIIDWRMLLRETVNYDVDWSYLDAEVEYGVIIPGLREFPLREAEIVLDTSGSINDELLRCFLRECKNILDGSIIKVGCFDTKFYGFTEIRTEEDIDNMKFVGRGGTNFNVAVNAFSDRVENKIIFTDGNASMPDKYMDAIWVVFGNKKINPIGGKVIYVDEQKLRSIYSYSNDFKRLK